MNFQRADVPKPLQTVPWSDKIKDKFKWFHDNAEHYIARSRFGGKGSTTTYQQKLETLYGVYNNRYPSKWFTHITNPLSAKNPLHKNFPALMRPVSILRSNLDYLINEFPLRPFLYHVTNMDPDAINVFEEALNKAMHERLQDVWQTMSINEGLIDPSEVPDLSKERAEFQASWKDKLAINGQQWLEKKLPELKCPIMWELMFKDWVIAGEAYSFKGYVGNRAIYERVSPLDIDYEISPDVPFVEDAEWVVRRKALTISDIVDHFYPYLTKKKIDGMCEHGLANPSQLHAYLAGDTGLTTNSHSRDVRYVYHVQWKGKKKVWIVSEVDPATGQVMEVEYDEQHPLTDEQRQNAREEWWNEVHECWKIGHEMYVLEGVPPIQRNEQTCLSACKLHYNGRRFSDTHAENISPAEIGLPYQIMYMIINRTLELTIAKSKGKIILFDKNAMPDDGDWDEEKFFYYAEATGWGLLDRNKIGVDKSYNQYQVVDMTLFDSIKQLIELQQHYKQEWDDIIGIPRQKRGQMMASDGKGTTEYSLNQSSIVTDGIFRGFEQLRESDLQGILDLSKFDVAAGGGRAIYYNDLFETVLMDIDPDAYSLAPLGVRVQQAGSILRDLDAVKGLAAQRAQDPAIKLSTLAEIVTEKNLHRLKARLKQVELIEAEMARGNQELEAELQAQVIEREKMMEEFQNALDIQKIHVEYDRKEDLEMIKGAFNTYTFQDGDSNDNNIPDAVEVAKMGLEQQKVNNDRVKLATDVQEKREARKQEADLKNKELAQRERESQRKFKGDQLKARATAKKKSSTNSKK